MNVETLLVFITITFISLVIRKALGFPIFRPKLIKPIYERTWLTGYPAFSHGIGCVATNCMWVHVTKDNVSIHCHFPFSIFLVPELLGMGWKFEKKDIIDYRKTIWGVRVRYQGRFCEREFVINVGDKDKFIQAISIS